MNVTYVSLGGVSILIFKVLFSYNSTLVNYDCQILEAAIQKSFPKKVFFKILQSSRENLYHSLFFNKFAFLEPATLLKKRFWRKRFHVNFTKFLRSLFL